MTRSRLTSGDGRPGDGPAMDRLAGHASRDGRRASRAARGPRGTRSPAPSAEDIERRFADPRLRVARPLLIGGLTGLSWVIRYGWSGVGADRLMAADEPVILAANHNSHADTAAILGTLPADLRQRTAVAAAMDVFGPKRNAPWRGIPSAIKQFVVGSAFHAFAFDRHGPPLRSIRTARALLRNGWNLLLYPEGTRGVPNELGTFKAGVGLIAKHTGRPVVPIYVHGGCDVLPMGTFIPRAGHILVFYGQPIWCGANESPDAFTERLRDEIVLLEASAERWRARWKQGLRGGRPARRPVRGRSRGRAAGATR